MANKFFTNISFDETINQNFGNLLDQGMMFLQNYQFDRARDLYEEALKFADDNFAPDYPSRSFCLTRLGDIYVTLKNPLKAEKYLIEDLRIRETALGKSHPDLVHTINSLADIYQEHNDPERATEFFKRAFLILANIPSPDELDALTCLNGLADCYMDVGDYNSAQRTLKGSVELLEEYPWEGDFGRSQILGTTVRIQRLNDEGIPPFLGESLFKRAWSVLAQKGPPNTNQS